ncbi:MAG: SNF2-related protein, partial [Nitrospinota bacterium]
MELTPYHAKYFAHELTRRYSSDSLQKLTASLSNAQVDLNPHQVEAALFAFRSPLSKGAILADEVGLGKTIEAGILISQKWAERKKTILIIVPSSLRKQWNQELADKFFLPSIILETKSFNHEIK